METNEKVLKPEESLQIIEKMIQRTKGNLHDSSFYFLLWGWIILIANAGQIILEKFTDCTKPYLIWLIIIPGVIASMIYGFRHGKKNRVSTHLDSLNHMIWIAFFVSYVIVIVFIKEFNYNVAPVIFLLAGNATFLTGIVIKFKPLILGGIVFWLGVICLFLIPEDYVIFISPIVIIFGYLVPGYMLKSYFKRNA
ncbi:MAG: hypothetical protein KAQ75_09765 [Bacteroidales bacterium]|nr:hypothetical protein [Bacteroidales bacterium]